MKGTINNDSINLFSQFLRKTILPRSISGPESIFSRLRHQFLSWELQSARWGFRCRDHPQTNCQRSSFLWALFWVASLITSTPLMWTLLILKRAKSKNFILSILFLLNIFLQDSKSQDIFPADHLNLDCNLHGRYLDSLLQAKLNSCTKRIWLL